MSSKTLIFAVLTSFLVSFYGITQTGYIETPYRYIDRGFHLDFGFNHTIPTNDIIFSKYRKEKPGIVKQPLNQEWNNHGLGGYIDLNYNFGYNAPHFLGASVRWTSLYRHKESFTRELHFDNMKLPTVDWTFRNNARLFNYSVYGEASLFSNDELSIFTRADVGLGHYRMVNRVNWEVENQSEEDFNQAKINKANSFVLTGDLGLGFRWQFSDSFGLRAHVGYQFQTPNRFLSSNYVETIEPHLNNDNLYPTKEDFSVNPPPVESRPIRLQHEQLYLQVGITARLDDILLAEKPVLYLYPEDTTSVNVKVNLSNHDFAHAYPAYNEKEGWTVTASPNGDLVDEVSERKYYTLFWETEGPPIASNLEEGFVVRGDNAAEFLENKLEQLGLNYREMNEFIIYWLPQMENNEFNAVYFAFDEYEATSQLDITPQPDEVIRVMMLWEPLDEQISLKEQLLPEKPNREGFVAVEWGGTKGSFFKKENELIQ